MAGALRVSLSVAMVGVVAGVVAWGQVATPNRLEGGWFMRTPGSRGMTVYELWRDEYAVSINGFEVSRGSYEYDESRLTMWTVAPDGSPYALHFWYVVTPGQLMLYLSPPPLPGLATGVSTGSYSPWAYLTRWVDRGQVAESPALAEGPATAAAGR